MKGETSMEYASRIIFTYGLTFLLSYYGIIIYNRLKYKSKIINKLMGTTIMMVVLTLLLVLINMSNILISTDGRLLIIGFSTFLIGPIAGLIAVVWSTFLEYLMGKSDIIYLFFGQIFYIIIFYIIRILVKKMKRRPKLYESIVFIILANLAEGLVMFIVAKDKSVYMASINQYVSVALIETFMFCALLNIFYREKQRLDIIDDLGNYSRELVIKNKKIESLYKEVSSNQEEMKKNFDELSRYEERIEYLAFHEMQTGFLNHEKLMEQLQVQKSSNLELYQAMFFIGIVEIEKLEKTLGITLLDTLHYLVGIEIMAVFEEISDGQIFSIAKGKYAILISDLEQKDKVIELYKQLQKRFLESFIINTIELKVNISAGGINLKDEVLEPEQWIEQCEFALYNAAADDFSEVRMSWYGKELMELHSRELRIEKELYKALEKNELYLVYQAQYNNDRRLIGAEALLRWNHHELGQIPPGIFIPIAERNGLIDSIGKLVLRNACIFFDKNRELLVSDHKKIPISINASFLELINPYYTERLLEILKNYNISTEFIRVEVTESEISLHYNEMMENLRQLNNAGIGVELDDFGTGYSSLNHLGSMPVHTIKIDKVFVDKILADNKIGDLVEMIIDFAHRFRMRVIAEGVETEEQFLWLRDKSCDVYQGYYFARPMTEELFLSRVSNGE